MAWIKLFDKNRRLYLWSWLFFAIVVIIKGSAFEQEMYIRCAAFLQEIRLSSIFKSVCHYILLFYLGALLFRIYFFRKNHIAWISIISRITLSFIVLGTAYFLINPNLAWLCPSEKIDLVFFIILGAVAGVIGNLYLPQEKRGFLFYSIAFLFALPLMSESFHLLSKLRNFSWNDIAIKIMSIVAGFILSSAWSKKWIIGRLYTEIS